MSSSLNGILETLIDGNSINLPDLTFNILNIHARNSNNKISLTLQDDFTTSYTLQLPKNQGSPNGLLQTDGNGVLSWSNNTFLINSGDDTTSGTITSSGYKLNKADGSGDVMIEFQQGGTTSYIVGIDDTDNMFKIHSSSSSDTDADIILDPSGNLYIQNYLTITGDKLFMNTNTDTGILVADGTNYNPVVPSGDITLSNTGVFGITSDVIVNSDIKSDAGIDVTKIHNGNVDNTEFGYLNGVTSAIQTQLDNKPDVAGIDGADGATGATGAQGATGPAGADGAVGADGADGAVGADGADGSDGAVGATSLSDLSDVSYSANNVDLTIKSDNLEIANTDGTSVCKFTTDKHVEIQGGLKIGLGGLDYGSVGPSNDSTRGQLFIQSTYGGGTGEDFGWWIGTQDEAISSGDNDLHFVVARGESLPMTNYSIVGYIQDNVSGAPQMNFTGQHRCFINHELSDMVGLLVSSTGIYVNIDNSNQPSINESLPICQLSSIQNDKSIFGVVSDQEDSGTSRTFKPSNFVSVYPKTNTNERRYHINSLGEGSIWITNKNNDLQNGDYITSSTIQGYGHKQNEPHLHNYTVAKITCDCNFSLTPIVKRKVKVIVSNEGQTLDLDGGGNIQFEDDLDSEGIQQQVYPLSTRFLLADGTQITESEYTTRLSNHETVYVACFVGCTYHCG
jgi:hypothetical protein